MKSKSASAVLLALGCLTMFVMGCSEIGIQRSVRDPTDGPVSRRSMKLENGPANICSALRAGGLRAVLGLILLPGELFHEPVTSRPSA